MPEQAATARGQAAPLRVGLVGCGTIAYWRHLRCLRRLRGVRIAGLADPDPDALARARKLAEAPTFQDPAALLAADEVDALVIASPAALHAAQLQAALDAGKHCYVEKPVAHDGPSLAAVQAMVGAAAARSDGSVTAVGYNFRFHPGCQYLRGCIDTGALGEVRALLGHFTESFDPQALPDWRRARASGGGVLLDLASHHLDLYRWLLRDELGNLRAEVRSHRLEQDSARLSCDTTAGVEISGWFAHGPSRSHVIEAHGTRGVLRLDLHRGRATLLTNRRRGYGVRASVAWPAPLDLGWRVRKRLQPSFDPSHGLALRAFVEAAAGPARRHGDLATLQDGCAALRCVLDLEAA